MGRYPAQGPNPGQGGTGHTIEDEGVELPQQDVLNYVGAGVTASDSGGKTVVDIPGTGSDTVIGRQSIFFPATAMYGGISQGALPIAQREIGTFTQQLKYLPFPKNNGIQTLGYFDWFPPQNWLPQAYNPTIYWTSDDPSLTGQGLDFQITAVGRLQGSAIGVLAPGAIVQSVDTLPAVDSLGIDLPAGGGVVTGGAKGAWVQFRLRRKSSTDSLLGELQLIGMKIRYNIDNGQSVGLS